ncbi:alpha/beta fold hydrolase [Polyangium aurulentum]|uniref:alpha/beta fold hydrolase n=1 Tax=Polyangium aurulentum TaxID=2567896 RepID=UPI0010AEB715|nr:alpha/beta fold hydrolase [Polyangium aurulentum]UQA60733.1 alpha/beta hydrolase [Polyangium aurulentum]
MKLGAWICWGIAAIGVASTFGCSGDDRATGNAGGGGDGGTGGAGGAGGAGGTIAWSPCPLVTDGEGNEAECAEVEVPLDWAHPEGKQIDVFVKRIAGTGPARKQLWLLSGGPGDASSGFEDAIVKPLQALSPSSDIYLVDHRGVGRSTRLGCPDQEVPGVDAIMADEWPACFAYLESTWGEGLGGFNTTNAAHDVGALIERTRAPGQEAHVFGVSYGTYWAQRYLQLFPEQPTSVTLDSLCQSGLCSQTRFDQGVDQVGKKFMGVCGKDAFCAGKLGEDPLVAMGTFLDGLDAGKCQALTSAGLDRGLAKRLFGALISTLETRTLIPALVYRGNRCSPEDVAAFAHLVGSLSAPPSSSPPPEAYLSSQVLSLHIAISEMLELNPPTLDEALAAEQKAFFWVGDTAAEHALYDAWPRYERDAYVGEYPTTKVPMLLMNGTLDPQTPIEFAEEIAPHYTQPHQTFVPVPDAPHGIILRTPTMTPPHTPCGMSMLQKFVEDPLAPVDTSCVADVVPLDFHGDPAMAEVLLGTKDLWENDMKAQAPRAEVDAAARSLDQVRRAFQRSMPSAR